MSSSQNPPAKKFRVPRKLVVYPEPENFQELSQEMGEKCMHLFSDYTQHMCYDPRLTTVDGLVMFRFYYEDKGKHSWMTQQGGKAHRMQLPPKLKPVAVMHDAANKLIYVALSDSKLLDSLEDAMHGTLFPEGCPVEHVQFDPRLLVLLKPAKRDASFDREEWAYLVLKSASGSEPGRRTVHSEVKFATNEYDSLKELEQKCPLDTIRKVKVVGRTRGLKSSEYVTEISNIDGGQMRATLNAHTVLMLAELVHCVDVLRRTILAA